MRIGTRWRGEPPRRQDEWNAAHRRAGCTLVELVVALVLCTMGLLAMLGASALLVREVAAEAAETRAIAVARSRLDSLAALECATRAAGSALHDHGLAERWWMEGVSPGVQRIADSVSYPAPGGTRSTVLRTAASC